MQDDKTSLELLKNFLCMYWWDLSYMVISSCTGHWKGGYVAFYLVQRQADETEAALKWLWVPCKVTQPCLAELELSVALHVAGGLCAPPWPY